MAIVLGSGSIEIVRSLVLAGVPVGVAAPNGDAARWSRYTRNVLAWDWPADRNDATLAERLVEFGKRQVEPPVLMYGTDQSMLFVSRHRDRLADGFRFLLPEAELIEALEDKARFDALAAAVSLPVPPTVVLGPDGSPLAVCDELGLPMIVKPTRQDHTWRSAAGGDTKALRIDSPAQLAELWPRLRTLTKPAIAQQCIVGPESAIVSYHVYVDRAGAVVAEFTGRKIRTVPAEYGFTTSLTITEDSEVIRLGREICRVLDLRGVAKLDFKYAADGRLYLLEINARLSLWMHPGARAGINLPALMYADLTGQPRPDAAMTRSDLRWLHPKDLLAGRRDGMSTLEWLAWARRPRPVLGLWRWDDPLPFLSMMATRARGTASCPPTVQPQ